MFWRVIYRMHQDIRCPAYILKDKLANANLKDEYRLL